MGGGGDTKKTLEQVQQELLRMLCNNANKLLDTPLPLPGTVTTEDLSRILAATSRKGFKQMYGYDFNGENSTPPGISAGKARAAEAICNITTDEGDQIEKYVRTGILNSAKLQDVWINDSACVDLVKQGKSLFGSQTGNSWYINNFGRQYDSPDAKNSSYKTDSEFTYCNAYLTVDGNTVKYTFLYYVGVYYEVLRPEKAVLNKLIGILAANANNLLTSAGLPAQSLQSPPSVQDIEKIMQVYCKSEFQKKYGFAFDFNMTKPSDIATNTETPQIKGSNALCYITDQIKAAEELSIYTNTKILSAMDLPPWVKEGLPQKALVKQLTDLLKTSTGNSWTQAPYGISYNSTTLIENSYKTTSVIAYTNASLTEGSVTVNVTLLNYMGVYYQIQSPNAAATQSLLVELCRNANKLLVNPVSIGAPPTLQDLNKILSVFVPIKFNEIFGFPFLKDVSKPTDIAPKSKVFSNETFFFIPPDKMPELKDYINTNILSGLGLPQWARDVTRPDLFQVVLNLASQSRVNSWNHAKFTEVYANTANPAGNSVKTTSIFVFTNATVAQNGQQVTATYMYYAGLYYGVSSEDPFGREALPSNDSVSSYAMLSHSPPSNNVSSKRELVVF